MIISFTYDNDRIVLTVNIVKIEEMTNYDLLIYPLSDNLKAKDASAFHIRAEVKKLK